MLWCYFSIVVVFVAAAITRLFIKKFVKDDVIMVHVDEFLGNVVSSVFVLELGILAELYGPQSIHFMSSFVIHLVVKHIFFMAVKAYGSILTFVDIFYSEYRKITFSFAMFSSIMLVQIIGVLVGQWLGKIIWLYEDHIHQQNVNAMCFTSLSATHPWYQALFFEALGVFIATNIDFVTPDKLKPVIRSLVTITLFEALGHVSGMWMHPVYASAFTFRCKGHASDLTHFLVYWLGPILGFTLSWEFKYLFRGHKKEKVN